MQDFVIMLLTCSATMSALGLIYMILTPLLTKHYSEKGRYYAWLIIVIGLIIPFRPHFSRAIITVEMPNDTITSLPPAGNLITIIASSEMTSLPVAASNFSIWQIIVALWLVGVIVFIAHYAIKHCKFSKMAKRWSEPIMSKLVLDLLQNLKAEIGISSQIGLYSCSSVGGPVLLGFAKPRILLPQTDFSMEELRFILTHELIHYKRKDLYYKALVLIAAGIHWFNPIVHLMVKAIDAACELSCDADTIRGTSTEARQRYSETIIGVVRFQTKLKTTLSTNFYGGKQDMKNRISAIMNTNRKKTGTAILCCILIFTLGTGMAFAAQTPPKSGSSVDIEDADKQLNAVQILEQSILSYVDQKTGKTLYSWDDGKTWTADYNASFTSPVIEWWTYDEYKVWMKVQIEALQALADDGIPDYYDKDGVLCDFTQADVDEAKELYQSTLDEIKRGVKVSKSVNNSTDTIISYDPSDTASIHEIYNTAALTQTTADNSSADNDVEQNYDIYAQFGLSYRNEKLYYKGELVRHFDDWYSLGEGMMAGRSYFDKDGTVDVYAERDFSNIIHNPDGSYDPSGKLVGLRTSDQAEFDARTLENLKQNLSPAYGSTTSDESSSVKVDNTYTINASSGGGSDNASGRTIAEIFEDFSEFGVTFNTKSVNGGLGNIYYNGKLVKKFIDIAPDGGVFTCSSSDGGTISLRTIYDANEKIVGVEVIGA